jgi:hypothetical protein
MWYNKVMEENKKPKLRDSIFEYLIRLSPKELYNERKKKIIIINTLKNTHALYMTIGKPQEGRPKKGVRVKKIDKYRSLYYSKYTPFTIKESFYKGNEAFDLTKNKVYISYLVFVVNINGKILAGIGEKAMDVMLGVYGVLDDYSGVWKAIVLNYILQRVVYIYPFINWKEYAEEWKRRNKKRKKNKKLFEKWRNGLLNIQEIIGKTRKNINYKYAHMYFSDYKIAMKEKFWGLTSLERADFSEEETVKILEKPAEYTMNTINRVVVSGQVCKIKLDKIYSVSGKKTIATIILRQENFKKKDKDEGRRNLFIVKVSEDTVPSRVFYQNENNPKVNYVLIRGMLQSRISKGVSMDALVLQQCIFPSGDPDEDPVEDLFGDSFDPIYVNEVTLAGRIYRSPGERVVNLRSPEEKIDDDPNKIRTVIKFWELPESKGEGKKFYAQVSFAIQVGKDSKGLNKNYPLKLSNIIFCKWETDDLKEFNEKKEWFLDTNREFALIGALASKMVDGYKLQVIVNKIGSEIESSAEY